MRPEHFDADCAKRGQAFAYLGGPFFIVFLFCQRPAARDRPLCQPVSKPLLSRKRNQTLSNFSSGVRFPSILIEVANNTLRKRQT